MPQWRIAPQAGISSSPWWCIVPDLRDLQVTVRLDGDALVQAALTAREVLDYARRVYPTDLTFERLNVEFREDITRWLTGPSHG